MKLFCKLLILFIVLATSHDFVFCQETLSYLEGKLIFQRPLSVTLWEERPYNVNRDDYIGYWQGKILLNVDVYNVETLKNQPPTLMSQSVYDLVYTKLYLTRHDLLELFNSKSEFVIFDCTPRVNIWKSYKRLSDNDIIIGETFFHANALNLEASTIYGYTISLIIDNKIVNIYLSYIIDKNFNNYNEMDRYFTIHKNVLYWKDDKSILAFYEEFSSKNNEKLPKPLQQLREAYELILQTLKIQQNNNSISNVIVINQVPEFQATHYTSDNLRLRERASVDAPTILILPQGTSVQLINTKRESTIDGITAPWVIVITSDGIAGWCFSGYLREY